MLVSYAEIFYSFDTSTNNNKRISSFKSPYRVTTHPSRCVMSLIYNLNSTSHLVVIITNFPNGSSVKGKRKKDDSILKMSIAVITGSIGADSLRETVVSVQHQTLQRPVQHWIVVDGETHGQVVERMLGKMPANQNPWYSQKIMVLPENTGGNGYLCHRINGALPWLVNTKYVCYLDEDNTFEPNHLQSMVEALESTPNARWSYGYRKIVDSDNTMICEDNCESLGSLSHTVLGRHDRHIDTNCYLMDRELAVQLSPLWNARARQPGQLEADRQVCRALLDHEPIHGISKDYTVRYRVCGRPDSVNGDFFKQGNAVLGKGVGGYRASKPSLFLFHFDAQRTADYCHGDPEKSPLGEWCPGMWHGLVETFNLLDGFANIDYIPPHSACVITMCSPQTLPLEFFKNRKDLHKILYTAEGPNIRHRDQWGRSFLVEHFDRILTHWQPLLDDPRIPTFFCPHNARFLTFPEHDGLLRENKGHGDKSIVMVLERRNLTGTYDIDGHRVQCLDPLREKYVTGLKNATVFGNGWREYCLGHPEVKLGYSMPRHMDVNTPIDHYEHRDFALIIENCDGAGYVSEKFGDALIAGAIPLYYGNPTGLVPLPEGAYIDIRRFADGTELQLYLDSLSIEDIRAMKDRVREVRKAYLEARGRKAVATAVTTALSLRP